MWLQHSMRDQLDALFLLPAACSLAHRPGNDWIMNRMSLLIRITRHQMYARLQLSVLKHNLSKQNLELFQQ